MFHKILEYTAAGLLWLIARSLFLTTRVKIEGMEHIQNLTTPYIIALWHNQLLITIEVSKIFKKRTVCAVISKSRDGNIPTRFALFFPNLFVIRVGHKSRGHALKKMVEALDDHILLITPDGPRGPCYSIKPGIVYCARKAEAPILPMRWKASKIFTLKSWDRFQIPYPFSKIVISFDKPIDPKSENIEALIQSTLLQSHVEKTS